MGKAFPHVCNKHVGTMAELICGHMSAVVLGDRSNDVQEALAG